LKHTLPVEALIEYLEGRVVTEGPLQGQPFTVLPWQREFIEGAFAEGVHCAALSVPRAAGKTTLCSGLASSFVDGPLRSLRSSVVSCAASFGQARIGFDHIKAFCDLNAPTTETRRLWRIQDSANSAVIEHKPTGAKLKCIGSDPKRAHGLAPTLILADEPAQWPEATAEKMVAALKTSMGKQEGSKILFLGTKPATEDHFFQRLLDGGADFSLTFAAGPDDDPLDPATWAKANPSLRHIPGLIKLYESEARQAALDAAAMASFKALRLNMGVSDTVEKILIGVDAWQSIECDILPARTGAPILGVDLGASASASGFAAYWPSGRLEGHMAFGDSPSLAERARKDHAGNTYERMAAEGGIRLHPGVVPEVSGLLTEAFELYGVPSVIICDRWRLGELTDALRKIGATRIPILTRGQGFKDGAEDVRGFRAAVLSKRVSVPRCLTWRVTMAGSRVETDPAGNAKLSKKSQRARDDLAAAAILCIAEGYRQACKPKAKMRIAWA
jgi:phage terminase large subunit-like protein